MKDIIQFKITLEHSNPPIWRRVLIHADEPLENLHVVIQVLFDWQDYHLHEFKIGKKAYGPSADNHPMRGFETNALDESEHPLHEVVKKKGQVFRYTYDFGDDWQHRIEVEDILKLQVDGEHHPRCIAGELAAPIEDSGGIPGYYNLLEVLKDKKHPEHKDMKAWAEDMLDGAEFDPNYFDIETANANLEMMWKLDDISDEEFLEVLREAEKLASQPGGPRIIPD